MTILINISCVIGLAGIVTSIIAIMYSAITTRPVNTQKMAREYFEKNF